MDHISWEIVQYHGSHTMGFSKVPPTYSQSAPDPDLSKRSEGVGPGLNGPGGRTGPGGSDLVLLMVRGIQKTDDW